MYFHADSACSHTHMPSKEIIYTSTNLCCHQCRISMNRIRKKAVDYVTCSGCRKSFCMNCFRSRPDLINPQSGECRVCEGSCCCCFSICHLNHKHCFTYRRTLKRRLDKARSLSDFGPKSTPVKVETNRITRQKPKLMSPSSRKILRTSNEIHFKRDDSDFETSYVSDSEENDGDYPNIEDDDNIDWNISKKRFNSPPNRSSYQERKEYSRPSHVKKNPYQHQRLSSSTSSSSSPSNSPYINSHPTLALVGHCDPVTYRKYNEIYGDPAVEAEVAWIMAELVHSDNEDDLMTSESNIDVVSDTVAVVHEEKQLDEPMIDASGLNLCSISDEKKLME